MNWLALTGTLLLITLTPKLVLSQNSANTNSSVSTQEQVDDIVTQFQSDKNGYFEVSIEPGTYILRPESLQIYPHAPEVTITVSENKFTKVKITYDSGIR